MITFFFEGLQHLFRVGTIVPSSPFLARAMTNSLRRAPSPKRVLEVGPGTGAITRRILSTLRPGDELHLVEVSPIFCRHLEARVLGRFRAAHPGINVHLHNRSLTSGDMAGGFDFVISSLPFRAFTPSDVRDALDRLVELTGQGGELTYMHFLGVRQIKSPFVSAERRRELRGIDQICRDVNDRLKGKRRVVLFNILPSAVYQLVKSTNGAAPRRLNGAARHAP